MARSRGPVRPVFQRPAAPASGRRVIRMMTGIGGGWRRGLGGAVLALAFGCASAQPRRVEPLFKDGVRQMPLTPMEAESRLRAVVSEVEVCYRREVLNLSEELSSYVFQVSIPTDASQPTIQVLEETLPGQLNLRSCLIETFSRVQFPAHVGKPITLRLPVEGPG